MQLWKTCLILFNKIFMQLYTSYLYTRIVDMIQWSGQITQILLLTTTG